MKTLVGVFQEKFDAESALDDLKDLGFEAKDISVIVKDGVAVGETGGSKGGRVADGAISGAATGGILGTLAGILVGIGAVTIAGFGPLLIVGPLAASLGLSSAAALAISGAATGALAGGLFGGLVGVGIPENIARIYEARIKEGAVLLAVPTLTVSGEREVEEVFSNYRAEQVRSIDNT